MEVILKEKISYKTYHNIIFYVQETLREMSPEEFERHKTALAVRRLEKPKQLSHRAVRYWSEIMTGEYLFERDDVEVEELGRITHQDLLLFFTSNIFHYAPQRRKMAVHVLSNTVPQEKTEPVVHTNGGVSLLPPPVCKESQLVEDVACFKRSLPLFPLVKSSDGAGAKAKL